jgi:hypothetical protein
VILPRPRPVSRQYGRSKVIAAAVTFVGLYLFLRIFAPQVFDFGQKFRERPVAVETAFAKRMSGVVVEPAGIVEEILPDSSRATSDGGGTLQRFVLYVPSGHPVTVLRDLAVSDRVGVALGDSAAVRGFYRWTTRGGVVHTTHADSARGFEGWIRRVERPKP